MHDRSPWPRRLAMPLVILAVAAVLLWHGAGTRSERLNSVRGFVTALCGEVRLGRDPTPQLAATDPLVRDALVQRLKETLRPDAELSIEISEGDTTEAGAFAGSASHVALLKLDGTPALGLRVLYRDERGVAIIGFWLPRP